MSILKYILLLITLLEAKHLHKESYYQNIFCAKVGGVTEYVLPDKTRVDCLTDEYAIEVDFASKWAESIGQSLYYAKMTNRKPAVYLILESPSDERFLKRLNKVAGEKIRVYTE